MADHDDATATAQDDETSENAAFDENDASDEATPLLSAGESGKFDERWRDIQSDFVDRPREAVEHADELVAELMERLSSEFSETRAGLERQWEDAEEVSTEELRVAMTRYRSFFERLLAA